MGISSTMGSRAYIGPATALTDPSAMTGLTFVEIGEVESIGEFGDTAAAITFTSLAAARVRKLKGARDAGDVSIVVANDPADAGQIAAIAAEKTPYTYAIKVVAADAVTEDWTNSEYYFAAKVMSARLGQKGANDVNKRTIVLAIDTAIHEIPSEEVS